MQAMVSHEVYHGSGQAIFVEFAFEQVIVKGDRKGIQGFGFSGGVDKQQDWWTAGFLCQKREILLLDQAHVDQDEINDVVIQEVRA
jgi:hypothetical protein